MPDWRAYVRNHLAPLRRARAEEEDVASELADHLDEYYAALRAQGMPEEEAFARTCARVGNWNELRKEIAAANQEGTMRDRVQQIWVPGLVTLLSSYICLAFLQLAGARPLISHPGEPSAMVFYLPWLFFLPLIGAVGGYLSRRAQGAGWRVYGAGSFPSVALGAIFLLLFAFAFVVDRQVPLQIKGTALAAMTVTWVLLPGIALSMGVALQALRKTKRAQR